MNDALLSLPSHQRQRLAKAFEVGLIRPPLTAAALGGVLGRGEDLEAVAQNLNGLERLGIGGAGVAAWVRMVEDLAAETSKPDLVWSGPQVPGVHARDTRRVFEELLSSAQRSLWVCTYAFFDGPKAFEVLAKHMDANPSIRVTFLLNIQRARGDTTAMDQLVHNFADRFWKLEWPGSVRPRVFYDPRALDLEGPRGVLHAKAVVVDEECVLVTSANFTEAALDRNIELGILVRDRAMATSVTAHFKGLVETGVLRLLPN